MRKASSLLLILFLLACISHEISGKTNDSDFSRVCEEYRIESASPFSADITLSKQEFYVDDLLAIDINLEFPPTHKPDFGTIRENIITSFLLESEEILPPEHLDNGNLLQHVTYTFEPSILGTTNLSIIDIPFTSLHEENTVVMLYGNVYEIFVASHESIPKENIDITLLPLTDAPIIAINKKNKEAIRELGKQQAQQVIDSHNLPRKWIIFIGVFILLMIIAKKIYKRINTKHLCRPHTSPQERALEAISKLQKKELPNREQFEQYYVELTNIIRTYIEEQYLLKAPEKTTEEFLFDVRRHPTFIPSTQEYLSTFLSYADLVKFARLNPLIEECSKAVDAAIKFITI